MNDNKPLMKGKRIIRYVHYKKQFLTKG